MHVICLVEVSTCMQPLARMRRALGCGVRMRPGDETVRFLAISEKNGGFTCRFLKGEAFFHLISKFSTEIEGRHFENAISITRKRTVMMTMIRFRRIIQYHPHSSAWFDPETGDVADLTCGPDLRVILPGPGAGVPPRPLIIILFGV